MISQATFDDIDELNGLINSAYRGQHAKNGWTTEADYFDGLRTTPDVLKQTLEAEGVKIFKYTEENQLLACVQLVKKRTTLYLGMLTVSPILQGRGIGRILLEKAEQEARLLDLKTIEMTVISFRTELIDWYIRRGYQLTGEKKAFPEEDLKLGKPKVPIEFVVLEKRVEGTNNA
jgi:ribosomal protein S18 acetylase RimI-like enzyme